jgi:hypothetical protein
MQEHTFLSFPALLSLTYALQALCNKLLRTRAATTLSSHPSLQTLGIWLACIIPPCSQDTSVRNSMGFENLELESRSADLLKSIVTYGFNFQVAMANLVEGASHKRSFRRSACSNLLRMHQYRPRDRGCVLRLPVSTGGCESVWPQQCLRWIEKLSYDHVLQRYLDLSGSWNRRVHAPEMELNCFMVPNPEKS